MKIKLMGTLMLLFTLIVSGCATPHETFQKALEKTSEIEMGKSTVTLQLNIDGEVELEDFNPIIVDKMTIEHQFNQLNQTAKSSVYASINNVGVDITIYEDGENTIITSPLLPKLLLFDNLHFNDFSGSSYDSELTEDEAGRRIAEIWHELLTDESVSRLGNVIVSTPDGDVKGREFEIKLTSEQLKPAIIETITVFLEDTSFQQLLAEEIENLELMKEEIIKQVELSDIGPISYYAYIDRDSYIIEEKLAAQMQIREEVTISIDFHLQRWDIGNEVMIDLPIVTDDNVMKFDEFLDDGSIDLFK